MVSAKKDKYYCSNIVVFWRQIAFIWVLSLNFIEFFIAILFVLKYNIHMSNHKTQIKIVKNTDEKMSIMPKYLPQSKMTFAINATV